VPKETAENAVKQQGSWCCLGNSQPSRWWWKFGDSNNTISH